MGKINKRLFVITWLFTPLASSIYLFKNFKDNTHIRPYLFLSFFFGLSFVVSTTGADSMRYAETLAQYHQQNYSLADVFNSLYVDGGNVDIYQPLLTWVVSVFTDNAHALFALFATIFGYFWFKSLILIRSHIQIPLVGLALLTFVLVALINPIWLINGVRMWTAMGVFIYGVLLLALNQDKKGWIYLFLAVLIHFSFILVLLMYVIYRFIPFKESALLFFSAYVLTAVVGELDLDIIRDSFESLPDFLQSKESYVNEAYVEKVEESQESYAAHVIIARNLGKYSIIFMSILMFYYSRFKNKLESDFIVFFTLALFFGSFSNMASHIPSGGRFVALSNFLLATSFLFFLNHQIKVHRLIKIGMSLAILGYLIFRIREGLDYVGVFLFIGNPIVNWFIDDIPLIETIKSML